MSSVKTGRLAGAAEEEGHDLPEHLLGQKRGPLGDGRGGLGLVGPGLDVHVHVRERVRGDKRQRVVVRRALVASGRAARQVRNHDESDQRDQRDGARRNRPAAAPCGEIDPQTERMRWPMPRKGRLTR